MKRKITLLVCIITLTGLNNSANAQIVTDIDGNIYNRVTIGTQTWLKENLTVTRYQNGDSIGTTTPATLDISGEVAPKYQWAVGLNDSTLAIYGRLYTWYAATDSRNVCPSGWKVASASDWTILENLYGGKDSAGAHLKETGTVNWWSTNVGADNSSGFTALPGGAHGVNVNAEIGRDGVFWTSTDFFSNYAYVRKIFNYSKSVYEGGNGKHQGSSIRCIIDNSVGMNEKINKSSFNFSPNPTSGKFTINSTMKINFIEIYNSQGIKILESVISDYKSDIDISSQPSGIYFVKINDGTTNYTKKIVVE